MKAAVWTAYGPPEVLQIREVEKPAPRNHEVLIRVRATTVTAGDCEFRRLDLASYLSLPMRAYFGLRKPTRITVLGQELAGEVDAVGPDVIRFKPGDQVFGTAGLGMGAYAEYICLPAETTPMKGALAIKPANVTYEQAAAVPIGGLEALHFLGQANIRRGEKVLINGAGGSIGTFGVQLARHWGADVTAVDSAGKLDMLRSLGAAEVIDYTRHDFTRRGQTYDVLFDVAGTVSFAQGRSLLAPNGRYLLANPRPSHRLRGRWAGAAGGHKIVFGPAPHATAALLTLAELLAAGQITTVIDRSYPLEQVVEAHRYVETGQKKGNVAITV